MASSGTIQSASKTVIYDMDNSAMELTMINGSGGVLYQGQEVKLKSAVNNTVEKRTVGTEIPFGVVTKGGADGDTITVKAFIVCKMKAVAKGGTLNAGATIKPNGTWNATSVPEYVASAAGDYVSALVISGGAVDTEISIGVLRAPYQLN